MSTANTANSDGTRPRRENPAKSAKLLDRNNVAEPEITRHRRSPTPNPVDNTSNSTQTALPTQTASNKDGTRKSQSTVSGKRKQAIVITDGAEDETEFGVLARAKATTTAKRRKATVEDAPDESIDENGLYKDVEVQDVTPKPTSHICDKIRDVNEFFSAAVIRVGKSGKSGPHRACKLCSRHRLEPFVVADVTTLRRHLDAIHRGVYLKWAEKNSFDRSTISCHEGCLAHIINLATQAVISAASKAQHYNPGRPNAHIPQLLTSSALELRDVIGLIRAIAVKERSSAQRKQLFRHIQELAGVKTPVQLILDMVVRWSSTYLMLHRAEQNRQYVDTFVYELGREERSIEKRKKIDALCLSEEEWDRVRILLDILGHADEAQQSFSSENGPSLHRALPAIERLHKAWASRQERAKYRPYMAALEAGIKKLEEYHTKLASVDVMVISLLLDPSMKMQHLKKNWSPMEQKQAITLAENYYQEQYQKYNTAGNEHVPLGSKGKHPHLKTLIRELSSDDETEDDLSGLDQSSRAPSTTPSSRSSVIFDGQSEGRGVWYEGFRKYLDTTENVPVGMSTVEWWGLNAHRYPVWGVIARDILSIMASSVSSERAFSQAGLTISKTRNRLGGDIVEALQCLKCAIHREMIFAPPAPSSALENDLILAATHDDDGMEVTWDSYLGGDEEDEDDIDDGNLGDDEDNVV